MNDIEVIMEKIPFEYVLNGLHARYFEFFDINYGRIGNFCRIFEKL